MGQGGRASVVLVEVVDIGALMQTSREKETGVFVDGGRLRVRVDLGTVAMLPPRGTIKNRSESLSQIGYKRTTKKKMATSC